jgi:hypothetical protein
MPRSPSPDQEFRNPHHRLLLPLPLEVQREKRLHQRTRREGRRLGARGLEDGLLRGRARRKLPLELDHLLQAALERSGRRRVEQIARWSDQIDKARIKRSRYQDQEAEGLMTREELRAKLAKLDETVNLAEAEMGKLRSHEERLRAMEKSDEELLERYSALVPAELENLPGGKAAHPPAAPGRGLGA